MERHDPELVAETRAWFATAAQDLRANEVDFVTTPPLTADVIFRAQQAAEKTMKGFLTRLLTASVQSAVSQVLRRRRIKGEQFRFLLNQLMEQARERYEDWPTAA